MGAFKGEVVGNRGTVSRLGSKKSGMQSYLNSYNLVCHTTMSYNIKEDLEEIHINISEYGSGRTLKVFDYKQERKD